LSTDLRAFFYELLIQGFSITLKQSVKKGTLIVVGFISLGMGIIGIIVPILPTTPLLLLAAACFFRGSPRMYDLMLQNKVLGHHIFIWREYHAITASTKVFALIFLWITLFTSAVFFTDTIWVRSGLGIVGIGVSIHLLLIKTLKKELISEEEEQML
jgi:uncharacterized membrane protein YbaN (DUF454 family)